ncbi:delta and Notch-like epidermal growth factor-related receptor [Centrocercus urophasianus]|uniref:delta and Notch-like epidermal growth factor-related receptor n=1 Tax=Centrocercus urophasianus TaxID=9002 RepID=UPI001C64F2DC|nr:delta and Notch-like epidermal growth factor-related receptor [Centrocercus urophasianus]
MPRAASPPLLLLLLLALAQRRACLPAPATAAPPGSDPCLSRPCRNNGTCFPAAPRRLSSAAAYRCACPPGVSGASCQFISDPCASNPCHHGNCSSSGDGYLCACSDGYEGANCELSRHSPPLPEQAEASSPRQSRPVTSTLEPEVILPHSRATVTLPTWQPRAGQKVVDLKWDEIEILPDVACGNASSNTSAGGRLVSFEVPQNTSIKIRQDATASLILLWKVTTAGFKQCSLIDGRSVTLLQALGGLVLSEEMLALGNNYFIGFLNDSVTKCIVALRLTVIVKVSTCLPAGSHLDKFQCSGKGKCITKPDEATFFCECEDEYWGPLCEEFDACQSHPCQNNATCTDLAQKHNGNNFTCSCLPGYTGELCQSEIDHCIQQPCQNGGTCSSNIHGFTCQCPEGFLGISCEEKVDPCASNPCQNNGTCYADRLVYSCSCSSGFTGPTCAQLIDFCALNPCAHGICRSVGTSYKCLCSPGLYQTKLVFCFFFFCLLIQGEECEIDINDCDSNPCHHAGTCIDQPGGYTCHCPHGWVGANCEIHLQWKSGHMAESLTNMPRHSLYIIIGALCVAFVLMLIILIVGICRISRIEYQGSSRPAYEEFYNCRSIDSEFSNAIASIRHARFGKKSRPAMYDATPIAYEDYSPDDKPLVTLIKTKDL